MFRLKKRLKHTHRKPRRRWLPFALGTIFALALTVSLWPTPSQAQSSSLEQQEDSVIDQFSLPSTPAQRPVFRPRPTQPSRPARSPRPASRPSAPSRPAPSRSTPAPATSAETQTANSETDAADSEQTTTSQTSAAQTAATEVEETYQYVLEFSRSPVVGNRLRLESVYPETRLGFTRPRHWNVQSAKAIVRYQHSPALLADRSSLTLRLNDTSIGSVPLDRPESRIGEAVFDIPPNLIQDFNDLAMVAVQHTSETCSNPSNPAIWTEILPDSKLLFTFSTEPVPLDLSQFPYPFIDPLNLNPNRISFLAPEAYNDSWLTSLSRFQVAAARMSDLQSLETQLVEDTDSLTWNDNLMVMGTPEEQPMLKDMDLPFKLVNNRILDGDNTALPDGTGLLILTSVNDGAVPALVITGNDSAGVEKAIQLLSQPGDRQVLTGQTMLVTNVSDTADTRDEWPGYLPRQQQKFQLSDLELANGESVKDITVYGALPPVINVPFKAPPGETYLRGSRMTLNYSYSRQVNPRTSAVEVKLDDVSIASRKLDDWRGGRKSFTLDLPPTLIRPDSTMTVNFILDPRDSELCGPETDDQLWATLHSDTSFNLKHETVFELPDLGLLRAGFPLAAPQDLSQLAIALPKFPKPSEVSTLMAFTKRLGKITTSDAVNLVVTTDEAAASNSQRHTVGIGLRERFPLPEVLQQGSFQLPGNLTRVVNESEAQSASSYDGILKAIAQDSGSRVMVAFTADSDAGLAVLRDLLNFDSLFSQIQGDTVLINRLTEEPRPYDLGAYKVTVLEQTSPHRLVQEVGSLRGITLFLERFWFLIPVGIILMALLLYAISQAFVNRVSRSQGVQ
ncbi:MAG: cellulose biosynthesis cyclic di-GMP-binding regulatory protein BcsB [Cyanobacteria bacterium P01_A01_bin.135]